MHFVGQLDAVGLLPAAKKHLGAADHMAQQVLDAVLRHGQVGLDGFAGLDGLGAAGHAVGVQRFLGRKLRGDGLLQFFVVQARQVAEQHRAVDTGGAGVVQHRLLVITPAVAQPQGDIVVAGGWPRGRQLKDQLARCAWLALSQRHRLERLLGAIAQQLGPLRADALVVVQRRAAAAVELVRPHRAFARLQPEFGLHGHQLALVDQLLQQLGHLLLKLGAVGLQVGDQQVHQGLGVGAHAVVGAGCARQLADQKHQGAQAGAQVAVGRAVALLADDLVVLAFQLAGVE